MIYLAAALAVIWLLTFGYLAYLVQRTRQLEQEVAALEELLQDQREKKGA